MFVYPDYAPIAKARVLSEQYDTYSATPPLLTSFIDDDSYDPNQRFSSAIDFVDPIRNTWQLYELIFNDNDKLTSLPIDAKISEDKKTLISGNINNPGSYYAKLTVKDNGGQIDTASTESVTLAKPSQRVIVFASTDPAGKKVYDPNTDSVDKDLPVKLTSNVTVLSGAPALSYKWDFGDGSCNSVILSDSEESPSDCSSPNPTHHYFDRENSFNGNSFTDRKSVTPKLTVVATFPNGKKEKWEASAGTITFNSEPNFVLVDISPDTQEGIVPFTVSFMIDPNTAKQVNATVSSYEIDYGEVLLSEDSTENGNITFDELLNKTFTHTYTVPGTYTPKLTLHTSEGKTFEFNVPQIVAGGTGQGGVHLLDDLSTVQYTNQPIVTFMIFTVFSNPLDPNNSLRIKVTDENEEEFTTELDPANPNQTVSLSEGKNTYYFETSDSSNQTWMSETREIVVDTVSPFIELISPNHGELVVENKKLVVSGLVNDDNFDSISYKINNEENETTIDPFELEDLSNSRKAFSFTLNPSLLEEQIAKVSITAKDKCENIFTEEVEIDSTRRTKLLNQVIGATREINNNLPAQIVKQGEPFTLKTVLPICDDNSREQDDTASKFKLENYSFTPILAQQIPVTFPTLLPLEINKSLNGLDDECLDHTLFLSGDLNHNFSQEFLYPNGNPRFIWPIGEHTITQTLFGDKTTRNDYGSTIGNYGSYTSIYNDTVNCPLPSEAVPVPPCFITTTFMVKIVRDFHANIETLKPSDFTYDEANNVSLIVNAFDASAFHSARLPEISSVTITKPDGTTDTVTNDSGLSCSVLKKDIVDNNKLIKCNFEYTPDIFTFNENAYSISAEVIFPPTTNIDSISESTPPIPFKAAETAGIEFERPTIITSPERFEIIESKSVPINSQISRDILPQEDGTDDLPTGQVKKLAKFGIRLPFAKDKSPISLFSKQQSEVIVKEIKTTEVDGDILFDAMINFNLAKNERFKDTFRKLRALGPIELYVSVASDKPEKTTFDPGIPQKVILLEKLKVKGDKLKEKIDKVTGEITKLLSFRIISNVPLGKKYPVIIELEPRDIAGNILPVPEEFDGTVSTGQTLSKKVNNLELPPETHEVKISLKRSSEYLNFIQERINTLAILDPEWAEFDITIQNKAINAFTKVTHLSSEKAVTSCEFEPTSGDIGDSISFAYEQKSKKPPGLKGKGTLITNSSFTEDIITIKDTIDPYSKLDSTQTGNIDFTIPSDWSKFSSVSVTFTSGNESDSCELEIDKGSQRAFVIGDPENKIATYNGTAVSVQQLKDVLNKVGLLSDAELGLGYTQTTENAWKLFIWLTEDCNNSNIKFQTEEPLPPFMLGCTKLQDENGNIIDLDIPHPGELPTPTLANTKKIPVWQEVLEALAIAGVEDIKDFFNPGNASLAVLTIIAALANFPELLVALLLYGAIMFVPTTVDTIKATINEIDTTYEHKSNAWKLSFGIGRISPNIALIPITAKSFALNKNISAKIADIDKIDSGAHRSTAEFFFQEQRNINQDALSLEVIKDVKREQLDTTVGATAQLLKKENKTISNTDINSLFNDIDGPTVIDMKENLIYKNGEGDFYYVKDLMNTPEDTQVIIENIIAPAIEHAAKSKKLGVENRYLFKKEFDSQDSLYPDKFNLEHVRKQGHLPGEEIPATSAPAEFYRVVKTSKKTDNGVEVNDITRLAGEESGSAFVFWGEGLTKQKVIFELRNNRDNFLKSIGLDPERFTGDLTLLSIKNEANQFRLHKPTVKDSNFNPLFRYNSNIEPFGIPLDLNTGQKSMLYREAVIIDFDISPNSSSPLSLLTEKENI